jgi:surface polysaccharide O-acyltransferase-like enzyme
VIPTPPDGPAPLPHEILVYQIPLIKGVCILFVVLTHLTSEFMKMPGWSWLSGTLLMAHSLARFATPTFIVLSGFFLCLNPRNVRAAPFYRRTLKYLLAPYVAYTVVYSLPDLGSRGPWFLLWNLATASAWGHMWFMAVIIQLYLVHPFLRRWYRSCARPGALVLCALAVQTIYAGSFDVLFPPSDQLTGMLRLAVRLGRLCFLTNVGYFLCGYYLFDHAEEAVRALKRPGVALLGALLWLSTAAGEGVSWGMPLARGIPFDAIPHPYLIHRFLTPLMCVGALLALVPLVATLRTRSGGAHALLCSLGLFAFGVYLAHPLLLDVGARIAVRMTPARPEGWLFYVLLFPFALFATLAAIRLVARTPLGRLFA